MLSSLRRWLSGAPDIPGWQEAQRWAASHGAVAKHSVGRDGFVIDGGHGPRAWRVEWGPSQRAYIDGPELRVRATVDVDPLLQVVVMTRPLMDALERQVYTLYTDALRTRLDDRTPEEMRWLAMSAKLNSAQLGPLRERYGAAGNNPDWVARWLDGTLSAALLALPQAIGDTPPFVLLVQRGRLVLRTALTLPLSGPMDEALHVVEIAMAAVPAGPAPAP